MRRVLLVVLALALAGALRAGNTLAASAEVKNCSQGAIDIFFYDASDILRIVAATSAIGVAPGGQRRLTCATAGACSIKIIAHPPPKPPPSDPGSTQFTALSLEGLTGGITDEYNAYYLAPLICFRYNAASGTSDFGPGVCC